jgi:hypothetical protein
MSFTKPVTAEWMPGVASLVDIVDTNDDIELLKTCTVNVKPMKQTEFSIEPLVYARTLMNM